MRKIVILMMGLTLLFFTACGGGGGSSSKEQSPTPTSIPTAESDGLGEDGIVNDAKKFLDKYYGKNLKKDYYETTEEFNQKREDIFAPIKGKNITFSTSGGFYFYNTYDADTSTGIITVKFYDSKFKSSVGDTQFTGYHQNVLHESHTTNNILNGTTHTYSRIDNYILDNMDLGLSGDGFNCEIKPDRDIECTYEYYAEPDEAKKYWFTSAVTIHVDNSEISHKRTYFNSTSGIINEYVGSLVSYTVFNGNTIFAKIEVK